MDISNIYVLSFIHSLTAYFIYHLRDINNCVFKHFSAHDESMNWFIWINLKDKDVLRHRKFIRHVTLKQLITATDDNIASDIIYHTIKLHSEKTVQRKYKKSTKPPKSILLPLVHYIFLFSTNFYSSKQTLSMNLCILFSLEMDLNGKGECF